MERGNNLDNYKTTTKKISPSPSWCLQFLAFLIFLPETSSAFTQPSFHSLTEGVRVSPSLQNGMEEAQACLHMTRRVSACLCHLSATWLMQQLTLGTRPLRWHAIPKSPRPWSPVHSRGSLPPVPSPTSRSPSFPPTWSLKCHVSPHPPPLNNHTLWMLLEHSLKPVI